MSGNVSPMRNMHSMSSHERSTEIATVQCDSAVFVRDGAQLIYAANDDVRFLVDPIEYTIQPGDRLTLYGYQQTPGCWDWGSYFIDEVSINDGPRVRAHS